jgi:hypothetical protein
MDKLALAQIKITPAMITAGLSALEDYEGDEAIRKDEAVKAIFSSMLLASSSTPVLFPDDQ